MSYRLELVCLWHYVKSACFWLVGKNLQKEVGKKLHSVGRNCVQECNPFSKDQSKCQPTIQSQHQSPKAYSLSVQFEVFHPHIQKQTVQLMNLVLDHLGYPLPFCLICSPFLLQVLDLLLVQQKSKLVNEVGVLNHWYVQICSEADTAIVGCWISLQTILQHIQARFCDL